MKKPLTYTIQVRMPDGQLHNMDNYTPEEREEIWNRLNCHAMETIGFERTDNQNCLQKREQVG